MAQLGSQLRAGSEDLWGMYQTVYATQRNWGARIRDVSYLGIRMIILENELLRVGVLAGKGTDIVELNYKPHDLDFAWLSSGGVRDPTTAPSTSNDPAAHFLDTYPGGWQEIFPSGGAPCAFNGIQFGQHGEVYALPWDVDIVEDSEEAVAVQFSVRTIKMPFSLRKTIRLSSGQAQLSLEETMSNESAVRLPVMWGQHITFGPPFLRPGCKIRLPEGLEAIPHPENVAPGGRRVLTTDPFPWPHALGPNNTSVDLSIIPDRETQSDLVYLTGFPENRAWYEIYDDERDVGSRIEWDRDQLPYLWYWQEFGAHTGYPWFGRNYNIGLEPFSSFPTNGLVEAVENGTALYVEAGEERQFQLTMSVLDGSRKVRSCMDRRENV